MIDGGGISCEIAHVTIGFFYVNVVFSTILSDILQGGFMFYNCNLRCSIPCLMYISAPFIIQFKTMVGLQIWQDKADVYHYFAPVYAYMYLQIS